MQFFISLLTAFLSAGQCFADQLWATAQVSMFLDPKYGMADGFMGNLTLVQYSVANTSQLYVQIFGTLSNIPLPPNSYNQTLHGFHVHTTVSTNCSTGLGSHYNPLNTTHAGPNNDIHHRHVGDLGNVPVGADGTANINITDSIIQIGTHDQIFDVVGRPLAIHIGQDDLGLDPSNPLSLKNGDSGAIVGCGEIKLAMPSLNDYEVLQSLIENITSSPTAMADQLLATAQVVMYFDKKFGTSDGLMGNLTIMQYKTAANQLYVQITGVLSKVPIPVTAQAGQTLHGFHVHTTVSSDCAAGLGSHYNPLNTTHGAPTNDVQHRHVGDLGNVLVGADGTANINIIDTIIQVGTGDSTYDVVHRPLAIHVGQDDLGLDPNNPLSLKNGNSGTIVACGEIKLVSN